MKTLQQVSWDWQAEQAKQDWLWLTLYKMKQGDHHFFEHPLVHTMFNNNQQFYEMVHQNNYPIERLVSRAKRAPKDVLRVLPFGILGDPWEVVHLLNKNHPEWRKTL